MGSYLSPHGTSYSVPWQERSDLSLWPLLCVAFALHSTEGKRWKWEPVMKGRWWGMELLHGEEHLGIGGDSEYTFPYFVMACLSVLSELYKDRLWTCVSKKPAFLWCCVSQLCYQVLSSPKRSFVSLPCSWNVYNFPLPNRYSGG